MQIQYHQWWSPILNREMPLKIYGHSGQPILVFPAQEGRFHEYEDFGMVNASRDLIASGQIQIFAIDGLDHETWVSPGRHPYDKAQRYNQYEAYILDEVIPFIRHITGEPNALVTPTGCSMGGYHSANFFFRHPEVCNSLLAVSGVYDLKLFIGDYMDEAVYYHTPLAYLQNMHNPWYLNHYRRCKIVVVVGQGPWEDDMIADTQELEHHLYRLGVPCQVDYWGHDVNHDWVWWRRMVPHLLPQILAEV